MVYQLLTLGLQHFIADVVAIIGTMDLVFGQVFSIYSLDFGLIATYREVDR
jgi:hypothetical protein